MKFTLLTTWCRCAEAQRFDQDIWVAKYEEIYRQAAV